MTRSLRPDELRIWSKIAATVTPRPGRRAPTPPPDASSSTRADAPEKTRRADASKAAVKHGPRPGPDDVSTLKRVRRGDVSADATLDLHGLTADQARDALHRFLAGAHAAGWGWVIVVTGKGDPALRRYGHDTPGVLRRMLPMWLASSEMRAFVTGYSPAHRRHGGTGAWYVRVRRPQRDRVR